MKKRLLSVMLAALLLLSCLPVFVAASDSEITATVTPISGEYPAKRGSGDSQVLPYMDLDGQSCVCGSTFYMHFLVLPNGKNNQYYGIEIYDAKDNYVIGTDGYIDGSEAQELTITWTTASTPAGTYYVYCYVKDASDYILDGSVYYAEVSLVKNAIPLKSLTVKDDDSNTVTGFRQMLLTDEALWLHLEYNPYNATGKREKKIQVDKNGVVAVEDWCGFLVVTPLGVGKATVTVTADGVSAYFGIEVVDQGKPGDPCYGYTDIDRNSWYHSAVDYVIANGLMGSTRTDRKTFEPNTVCTRSMIVSILYTLVGSPSVTYNATFTDVPKGQWYTDAVIWAAQNNVVSGYGNGKFGPSDVITREQLATVLYEFSLRYTTLPLNYASLNGFTDANKVTWSKEAMQWAVAMKILNGKPVSGGVALDPQGKATRAEVASLFSDYLALLG